MGMQGLVSQFLAYVVLIEMHVQPAMLFEIYINLSSILQVS